MFTKEPWAKLSLVRQCLHWDTLISSYSTKAQPSASRSWCCLHDWPLWTHGGVFMLEIVHGKALQVVCELWAGSSRAVPFPSPGKFVRLNKNIPWHRPLEHIQYYILGTDWCCWWCPLGWGHLWGAHPPETPTLDPSCAGEGIAVPGNVLWGRAGRNPCQS